jgi:hypothetical protein
MTLPPISRTEDSETKEQQCRCHPDYSAARTC